MASEVQRGKQILSPDSSTSRLKALELQQADSFIPLSHMPLFTFILHHLAPTLQPSLHTRDESVDAKVATPCHGKDSTMPAPSSPSLTAIFTTVLCSLLEHSLRLLWCRSNDRPRDSIARPSEYYVTLDGHGQRDKHEVMITPHLSDGRTRNRLIHLIGAPSSALLSDLFAAPAADAPNIRSALCHGRWDGELMKELEGLADETAKEGCRPRKSHPQLVDAACALVSCVDSISSSVSGKSRISSYLPVYSYTSMAVRNLNAALHRLEELDKLISKESIIKCVKTMEQQQPKLCHDMRNLKMELQVIRELAQDSFPTMRKADDELWSIDDIYSENQTNIALAGNIAALSLLSDASEAIVSYSTEVRERIDKLAMPAKSTKDRRALKTAARICSAAMIARDFYAWTVYMALIAIEHHPQNESAKSVYVHADDEPVIDMRDIIKATERSRMAISTFDSHIAINLDRSLKALQQYLQGKAVKQVLRNLRTRFDRMEKS